MADIYGIIYGSCTLADPQPLLRSGLWMMADSYGSCALADPLQCARRPIAHRYSNLQRAERWRIAVCFHKKAQQKVFEGIW